ncbi:MAG: hypothetical protein IJY81_04760, partial [Lachnospiraceae bacterium]|nr:hypothetical protein [Lachnospiraceae bacterium]
SITKAGAKAMAGKHKELEEHFTKREKQRESAWRSEGEMAVYWAYPPMNKYYAAMAVIWKYILGVILLCGAVIVLGLIIYSFFDVGFEATIDDFKDMFTNAKWYHFVGVLLYVVFFVGLFVAGPFLVNYFEHTAVVFTNMRVHVKRYGLKDKIITYEEMAKSIKWRKIRIRNGGYVIPYRGGSIAISVIDGNFPADLFALIEKKCGISLPKYDIDNRVRRSGMSFGIGVLGAGIMFIFGLLIAIFIFLIEGNFTWERFAFDVFVNPLIWFAFVLVALSLLVRLFLIPSILKAYDKYKGIAISLRPMFLETLVIAVGIIGYIFCV